MSAISIESSIHDHHVYRSIWTPVMDVLVCEREWHNINDPFVVAVYKRFTTVSHVPQHISAMPQSNLLKQSAVQNKFSKLWAHLGNLGKFALWENNPLYGTYIACTYMCVWCYLIHKFKSSYKIPLLLCISNKIARLPKPSQQSSGLEIHM